VYFIEADHLNKNWTDNKLGGISLNYMSDYEMDNNYFLEYGNPIIWTNSQDKTERQIKM